MLLLLLTLLHPTETEIVRWNVQVEVVDEIIPDYLYVKLYHKGKLAANFYTSYEIATSLKRFIPKLNMKSYNRQYILELMESDPDCYVTMICLADALVKDREKPVVVPNWLNIPNYDPLMLEIELLSWKLYKEQNGN